MALRNKSPRARYESVKIGYGYRRREAELRDLGAEQVFIDLSRDRHARADMMTSIREGDTLILIKLRDLGGSPVADRVWKERVEAAGATIEVRTPDKPQKPLGRPKGRFRPTPEQDRVVRSIWLDKTKSERQRLKDVATFMGYEVGKGTLAYRFGTPSNPKTE